MKKIITFICACFILIGSAMAQIPEQREYIYCSVDFINSPVGRCEIIVDFGQQIKKLFSDTVNDRRFMGQFNSEMAAINWMSRNGWELFMHNPHINEGTSNIKYVMRMDVTGMTEEQINSKLAMFVFPTTGVRPPQNPDGSFPTISTPQDTSTFLNPVPAADAQ